VYYSFKQWQGTKNFYFRAHIHETSIFKVGLLMLYV